MTPTLTGMPRELWMTAGACQDQDPDLFFPISESAASTDQIDEAREICDGCEVEAECLRYALANRITYGIWGGRTEQQRQSLIRARRRRRLKERTRP